MISELIRICADALVVTAVVVHILWTRKYLKELEKYTATNEELTAK